MSFNCTTLHFPSTPVNYVKLEFQEDVFKRLELADDADKLNPMTSSYANDLYRALILLILAGHKEIPKFYNMPIKIDLNRVKLLELVKQEAIKEVETWSKSMGIVAHYTDSFCFNLKWCNFNSALKLWNCQINNAESDLQQARFENDVFAKSEKCDKKRTENNLKIDKAEKKVIILKQYRKQCFVQLAGKVFSASLLGGEIAKEYGMKTDRNEKVLKNLCIMYRLKKINSFKDLFGDAFTEKDLNTNLDFNVNELIPEEVEDWCIKFIEESYAIYESVFSYFQKLDDEEKSLSSPSGFTCSSRELKEKTENNTDFNSSQLQKVNHDPGASSFKMDEKSAQIKSLKEGFDSHTSNMMLGGTLIAMSKIWETKMTILVGCVKSSPSYLTSMGSVRDKFFLQSISCEDFQPKLYRRRPFLSVMYTQKMIYSRKIKIVNPISDAYTFLSVFMTKTLASRSDNFIEDFMDGIHSLVLMEMNPLDSTSLFK